MTVTSTQTRMMAIGNETAKSGSVSLTSNFGEIINQAIADGADDVVIAIGGFTKANLEGMLLIADQNVTLKVIGGNPFAVVDFVALGDLVLGDGGTFTIAADHTAWIYPGDLFFIQGATTAANNGLYSVIDTAFAAGVTTIEVVQVGLAAGVELGTINAAVVEVFDTVEAGIAATLAYKVVPRSVKYPIGAGDDFTVVGPPGQIEIAGDYSWLQADDKILILEATDPGNNEVFTIVSATYVAPDTTIIVEEALGGVEAGNADCTFQHVRTELLIRLTANEPFMWGADSGILNPVLEDITQILATNASGTAADVEGRVVRVSP